MDGDKVEVLLGDIFSSGAKVSVVFCFFFLFYYVVMEFSNLNEAYRTEPIPS